MPPFRLKNPTRKLVSGIMILHIKLVKEAIMEREEILSKARNEKNVYDERETIIHAKSSATGKAAGVLLGFIIVLIEIIFFERAPFASLAAYSVVFCMNAVETWCRFAKLKGKFNIIKGIFYSVFTVAFMVCLIHFLIKG